MPSTPVKIGPFAGGLNSYSEPTAVGDNECIDILNFDIDLDGSLYNRAPIVINQTGATVPGTGALELLGFFIDTNGDRYLIASALASGVYARNEGNGVWTTITTTFIATDAVQYGGKMYLIANPGSGNPGGYWTPAGGFVAVSAIPKGYTACVYKERLFVGGGTASPNRVYFSDAANFSVFQTTINFFDVRAGDGQNVLKLYPVADTVAIFKNDSTYVYSYDSSPSRGTVRLINGSVGISNRHCLVEHENSMYIHYETGLYQISNWNFTVTNIKVPFIYTVKFPGLSGEPSLSLMSDRIVVHHFDAIYVFNLRVGAWTKWDIDGNHLFNYFIQVPRNTLDEPERYYGGTRVVGTAIPNRSLFEWRPILDAARTEEMNCMVVTKVYDFNVAYTFKRLFWWGVDILSRRNLSYTVHPVAFSSATTHAMMAAYRHNQILGNHLRPLDISIDVSGSQTISNSAGNRMFVKLLKSLRFRQIYFTVSGTTDGSTNTGPLRLYSMIAFIDNKQLVSKQVS